MIKICYFARLREELGTGEESLDLPADIETLGDLRQWLEQRGSPWRESLSAPALLMAVNHTTTGPDAPIKDQDELAFFPPVTGG